jgi:hypothetical protein
LWERHPCRDWAGNNRGEKPLPPCPPQICSDAGEIFGKVSEHFPGAIQSLGIAIQLFPKPIGDFGIAILLFGSAIHKLWNTI